MNYCFFYSVLTTVTTDELMSLQSEHLTTLSETTFCTQRDDSVGSTAKVKIDYLTSIGLNDLKWDHLQLNWHLRSSLLSGILPGPYWFTDYLTKCKSNTGGNVARLVVHVFVKHRQETIQSGVLETLKKAHPHAKNSQANISHIVQAVTYGFNALFYFEAKLSSGGQSKDELEMLMHLEAKRVFAGITPSSDKQNIGISTKQDEIFLDKVTFNFYSDGQFNVGAKDNYLAILKKLQDRLNSSFNPNQFAPVEITLLPMNSERPIVDLEPDILREIILLKGQMASLIYKYRQLTTVMHQGERDEESGRDRIPHLSDRVGEFKKLVIDDYFQHISSTIKRVVISYRKNNTGADSKREIQEIRCQLKNISEWLLLRQWELHIMKILLEPVKECKIAWVNDFNTSLKDSDGNKQRSEVFMFQTNEEKDEIMTRFKGGEQQIATVFQIFSANNEERESLRKQLKDFCESSGQSTDCKCYLSTSKSKKNGTIFTMDCKQPREETRSEYESSSAGNIRVTRQTKAKQSQNIIKNNVSANNLTGAVDNNVASADSGKKETISIEKTNLLPFSGQNRSQAAEQKNSELLIREESPTEPSSIAGATNIKSAACDEITKINSIRHYDDICRTRTQSKVANEYAQRSKLLKNGEPSIYELVAVEKSCKNQEIRWFEIGQSNTTNAPIQGESSSHKVLMLMGATGAGKSTLINGIINYVLGVEWDDPFRFCIVNEVAQGRNQAFSQTTSVTAYTIHHVEGMKIPYSITLIDTPGFGDTRGLERDEEINSLIRHFLMHPETQKDFSSVTAICLVASSAETRLTPIQQYILESVVSIFGNDIRDNIRLLVTFADGMKPPVLEAIREANIPGLSDKGKSIEYQQFNNSALYAHNKPSGASKIPSVDQNYWELGTENFQEFFKKLDNMSGQQLKRTQQVISYGKNLEELQREIHRTLKACYVKLEKIERLNSNLISYNKQIFDNRYFRQKQAATIKETKDCNYNEVAYNCAICQKTCKTGGWIPTLFSSSHCNICKCNRSYHENQNFYWQSYVIEEEVIDHEMKTKYEQNVSKKQELEKELDVLQSQLGEAKNDIHKYFKGIEHISGKLKSLALSGKFATVIEYVDKIKVQLEQEKPSGYSARIKVLDEILKLYNVCEITPNPAYKQPRKSTNV